MAFIPWFFRRLGVKYMLAAGMLAWIARYIFFAYGNVDSRVWMLWAGILLHGSATTSSLLQGRSISTARLLSTCGPLLKG
jgi:hypothetical protein